MKKVFNYVIGLQLVCIMVLFAFLAIACGNEDNDDNNGEIVVVNEDGSTSNGSIFSSIDEKNFYLDHVKYTVNNTGNLIVTGYDDGKLNGIAKIFPEISVKGHTYEVKAVRYDAFKNCSRLSSVIIPQTIQEIGEEAFRNCSELTSLKIPRSVVSIHDFAFSGCGGLESIVVEEGNEKYYSPNNCNAIILKTKRWLIQGCRNTTIPDDVLSIYHEAFCGCVGLTTICIPNSITYIGQDAFHECSDLTSIHCKIEDPASCAVFSPFDIDIYNSTTLFVPKGSRETYMRTSPWDKFKNIVEE